MRYLLFSLSFLVSSNVLASDCVILLHGMARTASSMEALQKHLEVEKYNVVNVDYPSRKHKLEELSEIAVGQGIAKCELNNGDKIHFVTHSLGGILVRQYMKNNIRHDIGRVVMLGPPNQGSEVVDNLKNVPGYELMNGPAGQQLGTRDIDIPKSLGPVNFDLGVIAGTQSINLLLSMYLPNPDDGKVSVEATKVEGMKDFIALPTTHPFMMKNEAVMNQVSYFLKYGKFNKENHNK